MEQACGLWGAGGGSSMSGGKHLVQARSSSPGAWGPSPPRRRCWLPAVQEHTPQHRPEDTCAGSARHVPLLRASWPSPCPVPWGQWVITTFTSQGRSRPCGSGTPASRSRQPRALEGFVLVPFGPGLREEAAGAGLPRWEQKAQKAGWAHTSPAPSLQPSSPEGQLCVPRLGSSPGQLRLSLAGCGLTGALCEPGFLEGSPSPRGRV